MEVYQVIEDNNLDWEDNATWCIAVFEKKEDAEAYAVAKQAQYDAEFEEAEKQRELFDDEYYRMPNTAETYNELNLKYPLASMNTYSKHSFVVCNATIPLNPTI